MVRCLRGFATIVVVGAAMTVPAAAADSDSVRPYLQLHTGQAIFTDPGSGPLELGNPSGEPFVGGTVGVNLDRHWGVQVTGFSGETELDAPGRGKVAELGIWTFLGEVRWRYPMWNDKFVPYGLAGAGVLLGEVNDQNVNSKFPRVNGDDTAFVASLGLGAEYFTDHNVSLGLEARYLLSSGIEVRNSTFKDDVQPDAVVITANMRIHFDDIGLNGETTTRSASIGPAKDTDELRGYLALRGGTGFFTRPDTAPPVSIDNPGGFVGSTSLGLNLNKHWSIEAAADYGEADLSTDNLGTIAEYSFWTLLGQVRFRYPMLGDRLSPYVVAGAGIGFGEINDKIVSTSVSGVGGFREEVFIGSVGGGAEYFVAENLALGVEVKYLYPFNPEIQISRQDVDLNLDPVLVSAGLRLFFPK